MPKEQRLSQQIPLEYWLSEEGQAILRETATYLNSTKNDTLRATTLLRKATHCRAEIASEALEISLCRQKARIFGEWTAEGFFTRQSLEQATTPTVANLHAEKFHARNHVLEICTGAGFDTAELAKNARHVTTIEANEHLAAMARHNLSLQGIANVEVLCGLAENICPSLDLTDFDGLWSDPSRRTASGQRIYTPEDYTPALRWLQDLKIHGLKGIKIAPAVNCEAHHLSDGWQREWIGYDTECREQVLWQGFHDFCDGSATLLLSSGAKFLWEPPTHAPSIKVWNGDKTLLAGTFLLEPHGALIRTGYLATYFAERDCMLLDEQIAYGIALQKPPQSPWYQAFEVLEALPFHYARLRERLQAYSWGNRLEIKKRGFPEMPEEIRKKLKLQASKEEGVLICTRKDQQHWALLAKRV